MTELVFLNNKTVKKLEDLTRKYNFGNIEDMLQTAIPILEWSFKHELKLGE